jgi:hypothetical protein
VKSAKDIDRTTGNVGGTNEANKGASVLKQLSVGGWDVT